MTTASRPLPAHPLPPLPGDDLDHAFAVVGPDRWRRLAGRRLFFTGGTGFVGKWMLASLIDADRRLGLGCRITVLTRTPVAFSAESPDLAGADGVSLHAGDVRTFAAPPGDFDLVIHAATDVAAGSPPASVIETCALGTRRVLDFARRAGVSGLLLVSSGAVYGALPASRDRFSEDATVAAGQTPPAATPASAYAGGKRLAEALVLEEAAGGRMAVRIARCFAFVGPYLPLDGPYAIGNFMADALARRRIEIRGDGTPLRSYLHAADMAAWLWTILIAGRAGAAYNVGGDEALSIRDLAARVNRIAGSPAGVHQGRAAVAGLAAERYLPDTTLARSEFALSEPIPLEAAIARTLRWHEQARERR